MIAAADRQSVTMRTLRAQLKEEFGAAAVQEHRRAIKKLAKRLVAEADTGPKTKTKSPTIQRFNKITRKWETGEEQETDVETGASAVALQ